MRARLAGALAAVGIILCLAGCRGKTGVAGVGDDQVLVQVIATGRIETRPDIARVTVGVTATAPTAQAALAETSRRMNAVLAAVEAAGVAPRDARTTSLTAGQSYFNRRAKRYESSDTVELRIRALDTTGKVVAAANAAGANDVQGPTFEFADPLAPVRAARAAAFTEARRQVEDYAALMGKRVVRVLRVAEIDGGIDPGASPLGLIDMKPTLFEAPQIRAGTDTTMVRTRVDFALGSK